MLSLRLLLLKDQAAPPKQHPYQHRALLKLRLAMCLKPCFGVFQLLSFFHYVNTPLFDAQAKNIQDGDPILSDDSPGKAIQGVVEEVNV